MMGATSDVQVDTPEVRVTRWRLAPGISASGGEGFSDHFPRARKMAGWWLDATDYAECTREALTHQTANVERAGFMIR